MMQELYFQYLSEESENTNLTFGTLQDHASQMHIYCPGHRLGIVEMGQQKYRRRKISNLGSLFGYCQASVGTLQHFYKLEQQTSMIILLKIASMINVFLRKGTNIFKVHCIDIKDHTISLITIFNFFSSQMLLSHFQTIILMLMRIF